MDRLRAALLMTAMGWLSITSGVVAAPSPSVTVVSTAKAGPCRMTVSGEGSSFLVVVIGLTPGEPLKVTSRSEGETIRWDSTAQEDGRFGTVVVPLVRGKSFGTASLEVVGQRCRIEASYPWRE